MRGKTHPSVADVSYGMLKRLMVIPFARIFKKSEIDSDLFDRIWATELPGVLNRALGGLRRVIERNHRFKLPKDVRQARDRFLREANPLPAFIKETFKPAPLGRVLLRAFYERYVRWATEEGLTLTQQRRSVRRNLEHLKYVIKHSNSGDYIFGLELRGRRHNGD